MWVQIEKISNFSILTSYTMATVTPVTDFYIVHVILLLQLGVPVYKILRKLVTFALPEHYMNLFLHRTVCLKVTCQLISCQTRSGILHTGIECRLFTYI